MDKNQIAALTVGLGIVFCIVILLLSINFFVNIYKSSFSKDVIFNIKKWFYILFIFAANIAGCCLVYYTNNLRILIYVILALKSKDIICSFLFLLTIGFKREPVEETIEGRVEETVELPYIDVTVQKVKKGIKEGIVAFIPIYKESDDQLLRTIQSVLNNNTNSYLLTCIISEGKIPYNLNNIFTTTLLTETSNYKTWLGDTININVVYGKNNEKDIIFICKEFRTGKKDSILMCHDIFNTKRKNISDISNDCCERIRENIKELFNRLTFEYLFCTDADTTLSNNTLTCLSDSIKRRNAVASCGIVNVDNSKDGYVFMNYLQNYQYLYGQYLRRTNEDLVNQVLCLPGCISMFKLHIQSNSDALEMFSTLPDKSNMVESSVQMVGTDRRFTNCLIRTNKNARIVLDKRCNAYTTPPNTFSLYVNQRRRWNSNMYFNGLTNIYGKNVNLLLRLFNILDYLRLSLVYFRLFNTIYFIYIISSFISSSNKIVSIRRYIPLIVILVFPTFLFFLYSLFVSNLRKNYFMLILMCFVNKIFSLISSSIVMTVMLFNIGNWNWNVKIETVAIV